jgi:ribonuclease P protein component
MNVATNDHPHNRYGFIITKKMGKAVQRNRIKRQLREMMRRLHSQLRQGYDVVIIARPGLMGQPFDAIQRIVEQLCHKLMLLSGDGG